MGFDDATAVALLDGATLQPLKSPDISGVTNGNLGTVAFSHDGRFLYAAGSWQRDGQRPIRRWSAAGDGSFVDLPGPSNTVMDLRTMPGGGVAFGTGDPAWAVLDADGRKKAGGTPAFADLRDQQQALGLSRDGLRVAFGYEVFGKSPATFASCRAQPRGWRSRFWTRCRSHRRAARLRMEVHEGASARRQAGQAEGIRAIAQPRARTE